MKSNYIKDAIQLLADFTYLDCCLFNKNSENGWIYDLIYYDIIYIYINNKSEFLFNLTFNVFKFEQI